MAWIETRLLTRLAGTKTRVQVALAEVASRLRPRVAVIDAGLGNIGSVISAIRREGHTVDRLAVPPTDLETGVYSHAILPGVGAFAAGMAGLTSSGWDQWICQIWQPLGRPLLGICLGMQLLASAGDEGSPDESGAMRGLDLIPGVVKRMQSTAQTPLPHIGWNEVTWVSADNGLCRNLPNGDFYFVNSYSLIPAEVESCIAIFEYGNRYTAAVARDLVFGVQFHPEKSQRLGQILIHNFFATAQC